MNSKKIYSMISLCAKAGRLVSGNFSVEKAVKNGSACAVIVACDAAHNTKKLFDQNVIFMRSHILNLEIKTVWENSLEKNSGRRSQSWMKDLRNRS